MGKIARVGMAIFVPPRLAELIEKEAKAENIDPDKMVVVLLEEALERREEQRGYFRGFYRTIGYNEEE